MTTTTRITRLELDRARLSADLAAAEQFGYNDSYSEFICGSWRSCMLWNRTGDLTDAQLEDYRGAARITGYGGQLPYLTELVERTFRTDLLKFGRLARLTPGSVLVPHRDYLELEDDLTRLHIPLQTGPECFSSEDETVYQMAFGELWFLDATRAHSAASYADRDRVHLILDFATPDLAGVLRSGEVPREGIPQDSVVPRRPLKEGERESFLALAGVIGPGNFQDVLAIVIKRYFEAELAVSDVFGWLGAIAGAAGQPDLVARARRQEEHCLVSR